MACSVAGSVVWSVVSSVAFACGRMSVRSMYCVCVCASYMCMSLFFILQGSAVKTYMCTELRGNVCVRTSICMCVYV